MATQNGLPAVADRGKFRDDLSRALGAARPGSTTALVLIGVSGLAGDTAAVMGLDRMQTALTAMYRTILGTLEGTGQVQRTGTAAFTILMSEAEPMFTKVAVGDLLQKLAATAAKTAPEATTSLHAGVAFHPADGNDIETLYMAARTSLRAARRRGPSSVVSADEAGRHRTAADALAANIPPPKYLGREPEMEKLARRLQATRSENGALVFLRGEPGIGKNRLLNEFKANIPSDILMLTARLDPTCAYKSFETVIMALEEYIRRKNVPPKRLLRGLDKSLADSVSGIIPSLAKAGEAAAGPPTPEWRRGVFQGLAGILTGLGPQEVVVICVHNVQWMDAASIELLSYLIRSGRLRVMLLGTVDDLFLRNPLNQDYPVAELLHMASAIPFLHEVRLPRLSRNAIIQLAETLVPGLDISGQERTLEQNTAGNPLSLIATLQFYAAKGGIVSGEDGREKLQPPAAPPRTLDGQVENVVEAMQGHQRTVARALSVLGRPSNAGEAGAVLGIPVSEVLESAEELIEDGLLYEENGNYWFTAEHVAQVVWRSSDVMKLREMHVGRAETAETGMAETAGTASKSRAAAMAAMRRQSYALHHRYRAGDAEHLEQLYAGLRNSIRFIFNAGEVDEYMRGDVGEVPSAAQGMLDADGETLLRRFLDLSLETLSDIQSGASNPRDISAGPELTDVMARFFARNDNLTLSFREGLPRALGQPLSAHAYGDTPSLLAQFMRAGGIWVVSLDHRTKIDEWLWLLVGLGFDPPPVGSPEDWQYFLQDKGVRYIGVEPAPSRQGSPPRLGGGRRRTGREEIPQTVSYSLDQPVQKRQSGKARSAIFDASLDVSPGGTGTRLSAEAAAIMAEAGVPPGLSPVQLNAANSQKISAALEKLLADARTEEASSLFMRVVGGVADADAAAKALFYAWLVSMEPTISRIGERRPVEVAARELMKDPGGTDETKQVHAATSAWMVRFLVDIGHYDLASALAQSTIRSKTARHAFTQAVMRSELVDVIISDLASQDAAREGAITPLATILAQALAPALGRLLVNSEAYRVRRAAARLIRNAGAHSVEQIVAELLQPGRPAEERARLVEVLDALVADISPFLQDMFMDDEAPVRSAAAALLHRLSDENVEKLLEKVEQSQGVSVAAAIAGKSLSRGGLTTVLKAVTRPDAVAQINAAVALGDLTAANAIPPRKALEALVALLNNTSRRAAAAPNDAGLARIGLAAVAALRGNPLPEARTALQENADIHLDAVRKEIRKYLDLPEETA
ncbi:MAG: AAA family ATPase [Planctomycetes bacterium]|nr:AAA family ATPase [Planctomycetota bacterium]